MAGAEARRAAPSSTATSSPSAPPSSASSSSSASARAAASASASSAASSSGAAASSAANSASRKRRLEDGSAPSAGPKVEDAEHDSQTAAELKAALELHVASSNATTPTASADAAAASTAPATQGLALASAEPLVRLPATERTPLWWSVTNSSLSSCPVLSLYAFHSTLQQLYAQWIPHRALLRRHSELVALSAVPPAPLSAIDTVSPAAAAMALELAAAAASADGTSASSSASSASSASNSEVARDESALAGWLLFERELVQAVVQAVQLARAVTDPSQHSFTPTPTTPSASPTSTEGDASASSSAASAIDGNGSAPNPAPPSRANKRRKTGHRSTPAATNQEDTALCAVLSDILSRRPEAVRRVLQTTPKPKLPAAANPTVKREQAAASSSSAAAASASASAAAPALTLRFPKGGSAVSEAVQAASEQLQRALDVYRVYFPASPKLWVEVQAPVLSSAVAVTSATTTPSASATNGIAKPKSKNSHNAVPPALASGMHPVRWSNEFTTEVFVPTYQHIEASVYHPSVKAVLARDAQVAAERAAALKAAAAAFGASAAATSAAAASTAALHFAAVGCKCEGGKCGNDCACRKHSCK
jgi:hypothetical protein